MRAIGKLLTILPVPLRIAWLLLCAGMVALATGYLTHTPWQSVSGLTALIVGHGIAILDFLFRKKHRKDAAGFYAGATMASLIAVIMLTFTALLGAIVLAVHSWIHGFHASNALRLLHLLAIVFAFLVVSGIPRVALRTGTHASADQDDGDPPPQTKE
jgi:hypothetical protein